MLASNITHSFGDRTVLADVTVEVPAGTVVGLLGPNGAGKTTFMRILFGVLAPDGGQVTWEGRVADVAARRDWGYMPQERGLYRDMRVLDHLVWIARLHGLSVAESQDRAANLIEDLGVADRADDEIKELSGGMAQRVQLAAAMVHDPPVLVLDEPFAGLDPTAVGFLSDVVTSFAGRGGRVLFSSHQLDLVEDLCETITMIDRGQVVLAGEVRALKESSPDRYLHVDVEVSDEIVERTGSALTERSAGGSRMQLPPGADAFAILEEIRSVEPVGSFGVDTPSLSELFLRATRARA